MPHFENCHFWLHVFPQVAVSNTDGQLALNAVEDAFQLEIARCESGLEFFAFKVE